MKFPYGISDFDSLITRQFYYADRTDQIPLLEEAGDQLLFLRPRRFGKSLLLSMLENYYDLNKSDRFEQLFGGACHRPQPHRRAQPVLRTQMGLFRGQPDR